MSLEQEENQELAYAEIKRRCKALKLPIYKLCEQVEVDPTSLSPWKHKDPKSISTYRKLTKALDELEAEK